MAARTYAPAFPLKHQQKDMRLAIALGDKLGQPLPTAAAANELYKQVGGVWHGVVGGGWAYERLEDCRRLGTQSCFDWVGRKCSWESHKLMRCSAMQCCLFNGACCAGEGRRAGGLRLQCCDGGGVQAAGTVVPCFWRSKQHPGAGGGSREVVWGITGDQGSAACQFRHRFNWKPFVALHCHSVAVIFLFEHSRLPANKNLYRCNCLVILMFMQPILTLKVRVEPTAWSALPGR